MIKLLISFVKACRSFVSTVWLITLFENRNSFVTFSPNCLNFIFFSYLIALTRTSSTIWIRSEERRHPRHFFLRGVCVCLFNAKYLFFFLVSFIFSFLTRELFKIIFLNFQIFMSCSDTLFHFFFLFFCKRNYIELFQLFSIFHGYSTAQNMA